jgi:hypothetical protein
VTLRRVPVDSQRADWPRLVAQSLNRSIDLIQAPFARRTLTATGAALATDYLLLVDATSAAVTVNLPAVADANGSLIVVKKVDASVNAVTIDADGTETIDGATTQSLTSQWDALTLACDGSDWYIV